MSKRNRGVRKQPQAGAGVRSMFLSALVQGVIRAAIEAIREWLDRGGRL
jgi:hypothetical protein